jgi:hypothetical protein
VNRIRVSDEDSQDDDAPAGHPIQMTSAFKAKKCNVFPSFVFFPGVIVCPLTVGGKAQMAPGKKFGNSSESD